MQISSMTRRWTIGWSSLVVLVFAACGESTGSDVSAVDGGGAAGSAGEGGHAAGSAGSAGSIASGGSSGASGASGGGGGATGTGGATDAAVESDGPSVLDSSVVDGSISDAPACGSDGGCDGLQCCYQNHCIRNGEPCGEGNVCFFGLPSMGSCQACGHAGQPCCAMSTCVDGSRCVATPQGARCTA
jgi:hypothetical protein